MSDVEFIVGEPPLWRRTMSRAAAAAPKTREPPVGRRVEFDKALRARVGTWAVWRQWPGRAVGSARQTAHEFNATFASIDARSITEGEVTTVYVVALR